MEALAEGRSGPVVTDTDGRFRFGGLTAGRFYRLRAWNDATLQIAVGEPVEAGTRGYVFQVPAQRIRSQVDGVVVGPDGSPLGGVRCRLSMVEYRSSGGEWYQTGQEVHTDDHGVFLFHDVPASEDLFIRYRYKRLVLTLGDDYIAMGRGIALSLRKIDDLGLGHPRQSRSDR